VLIAFREVQDSLSTLGLLDEARDSMTLPLLKAAVAAGVLAARRGAVPVLCVFLRRRRVEPEFALRADPRHPRAAHAAAQESAPTEVGASRRGPDRHAASQSDLARRLQGPAFTRDLDLGVLYLASSRLQDAKMSLDRVPPTRPGYAMALFKRAQVSVLLHEPDQAARIEAARAKADATTRQLIGHERLFTKE